MKKYFLVWLHLAVASFQIFFVSRVGAVLFLAGKIVRFILYYFFLMLIFKKTTALVGYNVWEVILFYLTFNFIDSSVQMLFREVYRFRHYIVTGNFDMMLVKPVNVLFRSLLGWTDILDLITLVPFMVFIIFVFTRIGPITLVGIFFYVSLIVNALIIAASFHILVLSLAVVTTEIDHAIMIYRDFTSMGRVPIDVYQEPWRSILTFIVPVGLMMSFPVKAVLGTLSPSYIILAYTFSISFLLLSLRLWHWSLSRYASASS